MEPQLLIASLQEHVPSRLTGQHDLLDLPAQGEGAKFDTVGVIIALLAMVGIMVAMAMMGDGSPALQSQSSHLMMSTR